MSKLILYAVMLCLAATSLDSASAADDDALNLQPAQEQMPVSQVTPVKMVFEAAGGRIFRRFDTGDQGIRRAAFDVRLSQQVGDESKFVLSDRIEHQRPAIDGKSDTVNLLREVYFARQTSGSSVFAEFGRINIRNGVALGYSPTDFFKSGSSISTATLDPVAQRENRLGTGMLRLGYVSDQSSANLILAPKLESNSNAGSFITSDLASTNSKYRVVVSAGTAISQKVTTQVLVKAESGGGLALGLNGSALVSDALVAYVDYVSTSSVPSFLESQGAHAVGSRRNEVSIGGTYAFATKTSLTVELEYNGNGFTQADWNRVSQSGPSILAMISAQALRDQSLLSRDALLFHFVQKDFLMRQFDVSGFARHNVSDRSHIFWLELRYHLERADVSLQVQRSSGATSSEFGSLPYRQQVLLSCSWFL